MPRKPPPLTFAAEVAALVQIARELAAATLDESVRAVLDEPPRAGRKP
jgi:hypothetical protein